MTLQDQLDLFPAWFWFLFFGALFLLVIFTAIMIAKAWEERKGERGEFCQCGMIGCETCYPGRKE